MTALPPWLSRALAVMLLLACGGVAVLGVVLPLADHYADTKGRIAQATVQLARYQHFVERLPQQRETLAALDKRQGSNDGFLAGANDTLIGAELQNRVKSTVEAAQGALKSTQALPPRDEGDFRRIAVRGDMTADISAAQMILYQLETTSPMLFLDNVDIRP